MPQSRNLLLIIDAHAHDTMKIVIMIHTDDYNDDDDWGEDDGSYSASRNWARQMILATHFAL